MVKGKLFRIFHIVFTVAFVLGCFLCLLFPLPGTVGGAGSEAYLCTWEDGRATEESYLSAYASLVGIGGDGVVLERNGLRGTISVGEAAECAYNTLLRGSLAELLSITCEELARIERAATYRTFGDTLYCDGEYFRYTGEGVERSPLFQAERMELLGSLPDGALQDAGIKFLHIRAGAKFTPAALRAESLKTITADAPYEVKNGAITLNTAGGVRLVAGCPYATAADVADVAFLDRGALVSCMEIEELSLPFLGERLSSAGDLGGLFGTDEADAYEIPPTLRRIRVRGGKVSATAFYRCDALEEIDLCGIAPQDIAENAFYGLSSLKRLHCARRDALSDGFLAERADCGCYIYTRIK